MKSSRHGNTAHARDVRAVHRKMAPPAESCSRVDPCENTVKQLSVLVHHS